MKKLVHTLYNCTPHTVQALTNHFSLVSTVKKIDLIPTDTELNIYEVILHVPEDITEEQIFNLGILMGAFDFKIK